MGLRIAASAVGVSCWVSLFFVGGLGLAVLFLMVGGSAGLGTRMFVLVLGYCCLLGGGFGLDCDGARSVTFCGFWLDGGFDV